MHADISRRTFDAADGYRSVVLQQGRVLLDADWNEQAEITAHHDEMRTLDAVGRCGGPAASPDAPGAAALGPFAVVAADGTRPDDPTAPVPWQDLRITPGRYYVDGVLAESAGPGETGGAPTGSGWPLTDQPYLATIGSGATAAPGVPEPPAAADGDRYVLHLDVWSHHVTADEDPALLEPALGGPDTTTRVRTVWQVRPTALPGALPGTGDKPRCSDAHAAAATPRVPRRMVASLTAAGAGGDPCTITASGGYERLENQLYRVQIHAGTSGGGAGTFLWSRDNGIVVAGLSGLELDTDGSGTDIGTLTLDRLGRDEELSFAAGQLVEVTSTDLQLRGVPGFLAVAGTAVLVLDAGGSSSTLDLPVTWLDDVPAGLEALGRAPIARRWDGGPTELAPSGGGAGDPIPLEGGIRVSFPPGGEARTGDYWLVPARTVVMAYGLSQRSGTIEWPPGGRGPQAQPPVGPRLHRTPLAILRRVAGGPADGWVVESDCRLLFPPLTDQITIDLVGGDGQEAMPGSPLAQPVRVAVRNGGRPLPGAHLAVDAGTGAVSGAAVTGADGVAALRWTLDAAGAATQTLTVRRLDDHDAPVDVAVVATGRLSVAREVAWSPPGGCTGFTGSRTVQDALTRLVGTVDLRLLGGDGQSADAAGRVLPQQVRVIVDGPCGPQGDVEVTALSGIGKPTTGLVAGAPEGQPRPDTLSGTGATSRAVVRTGPDGAAAFWWQPGFGADRSGTLDVFIEKSPEAPVRVAAHLDPGGGASPGVHVVAATWRTGVPFLNDSIVGADQLMSGVVVELDGEILPGSVRGKPVVRMILELPWPFGGQDQQLWQAPLPIGFHDLQLGGLPDADAKSISWIPAPPTRQWLSRPLWDVLGQHGWDAPIVGRFVIDGFAVIAADESLGHLNGHADAVPAQARTHLQLPTDDEVTGGAFTRWFQVVPPEAAKRRIEMPDVSGRTEAVAVRMLEAAGLTVATVNPERSDTVRAKLVIGTEPKAGTTVDEGAAVIVAISIGRG